jgi:hypothetical protein
MTAETNTESQARSETIKMELTEFLKDASFGDPKHQAFCDWCLEDGLQVEINKQIERMTGKAALREESELRILEYRTALLNHEIDQKKSRLPGYEHAYWTIYGSFEGLYSALHNEGRNKYPNDSAAADQYADENCDRAEYDVLPDRIKGEPKATP